MEHARRTPPAQIAFASAMIALGVLGFIYGDVALVWQHLPVANLPGEKPIAYLFAAIELAGGLGLLWRGTHRQAGWLLLVFLLIWAVLLKMPAVVAVPRMEATWLGLGEITVMLAGAWALLAFGSGRTHRGGFAGQRGIQGARVLFALSLPMIGLSHFFYSEQTLALVPAWLPYRLGWAYLTGAGSLAACAGVLLGVYPRLAALLEAAMLGTITVLVWVPAVVTAPTDRTAWTALAISAGIASGAWLVAETYRHVPLTALGRRAVASPAL